MFQSEGFQVLSFQHSILNETSRKKREREQILFHKKEYAYENKTKKTLSNKSNYIHILHIYLNIFQHLKYAF